ncbi:UNVERIFIED_CONTAM: hypothetical protein KB574_07670 [Streptococcus canis]|uniref:Uncharacterized protein n=1 Tax=Streptococcus canis TaxID=1329 RepID=A0AAE4TS54_STRCB|nr:hypothetical protein [Streptococcus canis]MDV5976622.1 hypothetical protein [Streptococcus canis]QJD11574.1 hypothetical protein GE024_01145 [Streptococcus canis]QKG73011.1 hypothetical protein GE023_001190 [Streptococcus canis]VTR79185.1 Uncharacterised protein [Streptococcus canis]GFE42699.1 hypothetical protein ScFU1_03810 [Streptococcus canis]
MMGENGETDNWDYRDMGISGLAVLLTHSHQKKDDLANMESFYFDNLVHFSRGIPFQKDVASVLINSPINEISFDYHNMAVFWVG